MYNYKETHSQCNLGIMLIVQCSVYLQHYATIFLRNSSLIDFKAIFEYIAWKINNTFDKNADVHLVWFLALPYNVLFLYDQLSIVSQLNFCRQIKGECY